MARILIVEDEHIIARNLHTKLVEMSHRSVQIAHSKDEAVELASAQNFDLALVDIYMGGRDDGFETAQILLSRFNVPTIFLTAYSDNDTLEKVKDATQYGYLMKPFRESELRLAIEIALQRKEAENKLVSAAVNKGSVQAVSLSPREREVCELIKTGMGTSEIAKTMKISPATVNTVRNRIRKKLGLENKKVNLVSFLRLSPLFK